MTVLENALDSLYHLCFGDSKSYIDPRDKDKAIEVFIVLKQNNHQLDLDEIRKYLKVNKNAASGFIDDALKYATMVIRGTRKKRPGVLNEDIYNQWI
jgi:hypothetical protein